MNTSKLIIVSVLAGLAIVLIGLNIRDAVQATSSLQSHASVAPTSESIAVAAPFAEVGRNSNPYDPLLLNRPGNLAAVRQAFPVVADERLADGRSFIAFDMASAMRLDQGDMFALALPGEENPVAAQIESVSTFEGMRRWTGRFVGTDIEPNEFSLTLSADGLYAAGNFTHGEQSFVMEAKDGAGWFNASATENDHLMSEEF